MIEIGGNDVEGVVKLRCSDDGSPDGYIVQVINPGAARAIAEWLLEGTPRKVLLICDGKRFRKHELTAEMAKDVASKLIYCANRVESKSLN